MRHTLRASQDGRHVAKHVSTRFAVGANVGAMVRVGRIVVGGSIVSALDGWGDGLGDGSIGWNEGCGKGRLVVGLLIGLGDGLMEALSTDGQNPLGGGSRSRNSVAPIVSSFLLYTISHSNVTRQSLGCLRVVSQLYHM